MTKKAIHCSTDIFDNQRTMGFSTLAGGIKNVVVWSGCIWLQSLLIHWPNTEDSRFMLSSVAPPLVLQFNDQIDQSGTEFQDCNVPLGDVKVHSIPGQNLLDASSYCELHGEADCCNKFDSDIDCIDQPKAVSLHNVSLSAKYLLNALKESVSRRTSKDYIYQFVQVRMVFLETKNVLQGSAPS
ncbi:uncharacterized protein LOC116245280 [Nymphaea colorata]|nr:uncharacterized protein LOC116245280 [Nymphaea colorata]